MENAESNAALILAYLNSIYCGGDCGYMIPSVNELLGASVINEEGKLTIRARDEVLIAQNKAEFDETQQLISEFSTDVKSEFDETQTKLDTMISNQTTGNTALVAAINDLTTAVTTMSAKIDQSNTLLQTIANNTTPGTGA